ncbi:hypothetical protein G4B88_021418 [Cannabis sativa]|uniref:Uncharacterized protein n=1 Tax=Cannabis sativa TaxID=3483 RepID=A0A7J6FFZ2_CANSA|nr:hypothetical protein G4B88_021418 [Cannabis sativa]
MKPQAVSHSDYWTVVDEIGFMLWHMLRVTNESDYGVSLQVLRDSDFVTAIFTGARNRRTRFRTTFDDMHYDFPVYEAALQIMLNALLIESHQKL